MSERKIDTDAIIDGIKIFMKMMDNEVVREFADETIRFAEKKIKATETQWDDVLLLPVLELIRKAAKIG